MTNKLKKIVFYTTYGCHLCEEVEVMFYKIFTELQQELPFELTQFDIIDDENILQKYRATIPVLLDTSIQKELAWPFTLDELKNFLFK